MPALGVSDIGGGVTSKFFWSCHWLLTNERAEAFFWSYDWMLTNERFGKVNYLIVCFKYTQTYRIRVGWPIGTPCT